LLALFGEQHRHRIGFLAGRHAAMPDGDAPLGRIGFANMLKRGLRYVIEHTVFAVEIGFVVEHRIDRVVEQLPAGRGDERGDKRVEIGDAVTLHHRLQRHFDPPYPVRRQRLAGARFEHAHQHAIGGLAGAAAHHGFLPPPR
jgi:hypothetical protein